ncbi:baseplate J/gp47 family protein [Calothrix sp. FACHB-1219]|uniref:baseplate J/gp47 family protein n=1 Tax=unclassified Calothrix TaxID=2619626 RepID=UPI0016896A8C|nr:MULTISPECIES: baseplate J/gp47 family protein [unclassified Calothrix]MBD2201536.1 baseplate J/gp47 family protein [Calothrix sp. FACHB-168]MBD2217222.1 baseplate J/gp47 family protein [Calothrix sp. FACHB-1219]
MKEALSSLGSPLSRFSQYSNIYILFRSIASVISEHEYLIDQYRRSTSITLAERDDLDVKAYDYSLFRRPATPGSGFVLVTSNEITQLSAGLILSSADGLVQFTLDDNYFVNNSEVALPITSIERDYSVNLSAGTSLYSTFYPNIKFVIGQYRDSKGKPQIGISGAYPEESDDTFRQRILFYLNSLEKGTYTAVYSTILNSGIDRFYIKEHQPVTGYFTVFVNTSNERKLREIEEAIDSVKALGVAFIVRPLEVVYLDVLLTVKLINTSNINSTVNAIREKIIQYFNDLDLGQPVDRLAIKNLALSVPNVSACSIQSPSNVISPNTLGVFAINNLSINIQS